MKNTCSNEARNATLKGRRLLFALGAAVATSACWAATTFEVSNVTQLTNAIDRASDDDTIILAAGRYDLFTFTEHVAASGTWGTMSTPDERAGLTCLWFSKRLIVKGANTSSWRDKATEQESILDGGGVASIVYVYTGTGRESSFHHLTFENGAAESGKPGGGIYSLGPAGTVGKPNTGFVTNCVFRNCSAKEGGGTYAYNVCDSLFDACRATDNGGGAYGFGSSGYKYQATNRFEKCEFRSCSANKGGGLYHLECRETAGSAAGYVADCVFSNCTATTGGALYEKDAGIVRGCRFMGNSSDTGALFAEKLHEGTLVTNCTFEGNISRGSGGAIGKWKQVADSTFVGNIATNTAGAAIDCELMRGCVFSNNVALCLGSSSSKPYGGGALYGVTARSCAFVGNASSKSGGAMYSGTASNCVFEANVSTNQGGACAYTAATGCIFTENQSLTHRGGACSYGTAVYCAFTNNYAFQNGRGGACTFVNARNCIFSGVGDVSCGSFDSCVFDGVVSAPEPRQQKYVFDSLRNGGTALCVTNCLVINCNVDRIINNDGRNVEFVNCTFADNTIVDNRTMVRCDRGTDYSKKENNEYRYFPGTNVLINCLFSGNRFTNGNPADLTLYKYTDETDFGFCSLQLRNCLYTDGANLPYADVQENLVHGDPHFVAGDAKFPGAPWYSIRYASAARNVGANAAWMSAAVDLVGNPRINDSVVDIGCYECILQPEGTRIIFK